MPTVLPESLADKMITEKIREWREKQANIKNLLSSKTHPFLAISRDFGCGEEKLIPQLEKYLGWKVYGKNLLNHIAERDELSKSFLETLDEKKQILMDEWVNYLIHSGAILPKDYVLRISRLMEAIVRNESAILLGRGATCILSGKPGGLRIKLTAPFKNRVENIAEIRGLSAIDAEKFVRDKDMEREKFIKAYFKKDLLAFSDFDLVFNTSTISADVICSTVKFILQGKAFRGSQ